MTTHQKSRHKMAALDRLLLLFVAVLGVFLSNAQSTIESPITSSFISPSPSPTVLPSRSSSSNASTSRSLSVSSNISESSKSSSNNTVNVTIPVSTRGTSPLTASMSIHSSTMENKTVIIPSTSVSPSMNYSSMLTDSYTSTKIPEIVPSNTSATSVPISNTSVVVLKSVSMTTDLMNTISSVTKHSLASVVMSLSTIVKPSLPASSTIDLGVDNTTFSKSTLNASSIAATPASVLLSTNVTSDKKILASTSSPNESLSTIAANNQSTVMIHTISDGNVNATASTSYIAMLPSVNATDYATKSKSLNITSTMSAISAGDSTSSVGKSNVSMATESSSTANITSPKSTVVHVSITSSANITSHLTPCYVTYVITQKLNETTPSVTSKVTENATESTSFAKSTVVPMETTYLSDATTSKAPVLSSVHPSPVTSSKVALHNATSSAVQTSKMIEVTSALASNQSLTSSLVTGSASKVLVVESSAESSATTMYQPENSTSGVSSTKIHATQTLNVSQVATFNGSSSSVKDFVSKATTSMSPSANSTVLTKRSSTSSTSLASSSPLMNISPVSKETFSIVTAVMTSSQMTINPVVTDAVAANATTSSNIVMDTKNVSSFTRETVSKVADSVAVTTSEMSLNATIKKTASASTTAIVLPSPSRNVSSTGGGSIPTRVVSSPSASTNNSLNTSSLNTPSSTISVNQTTTTISKSSENASIFTPSQTLSSSSSSSKVSSKRRRRRALPGSSNSSTTSSLQSSISQTSAVLGLSSSVILPVMPTITSIPAISPSLSSYNSTHSLPAVNSSSIVSSISMNVSLTSTQGIIIGNTVNISPSMITVSAGKSSINGSSINATQVLPNSTIITSTAMNVTMTASPNVSMATPVVSETETMSSSVLFGNRSLTSSSVITVPNATIATTYVTIITATKSVAMENTSSVLPAPSSSIIHDNANTTFSSSPSDNATSTAPPVTVVMPTSSVALTAASFIVTTPLIAMSSSIDASSSYSVASELNVTKTASSHSVMSSAVYVKLNVSLTRTVLNYTSTSIHPTPLVSTPPVYSSSSAKSVDNITSTVQSSSTKPILLTTSSLSMCYVVYTTRIMPSPSSVVVANSSTIFNSSSVMLNASSTIVPTLSKNASSAIGPTLNLNTSSSTIMIVPPVSRNISSTILLTPSNSTSSAIVPTSSSAMIKANSTILSPSPSSTTSNKTMSSVQSTRTIVNSTVVQPTSVIFIVNTTVNVNATDYSPQATTSLPNNSTSKAVNSTSVSMTAMPVTITTIKANSTVYPMSTIKGVDASSVISSMASNLSTVYSSVLISPSITSSVAIVSSSVTIVTTSAPPTTAPSTSSLLKVTLEIDLKFDVKSPEVQNNISKGLEITYNSGLKARRRRRATAGTEAQIYNVTRKASPSKDAVVIFSISKDGKTMPASDAEKVFNKINTLDELSKNVGYQVVSRPEAIIQPTPPPPSIAVSMICENTVKHNLTIPAEKKWLEGMLVSYYVSKTKTTNNINAVVSNVIIEKSGNFYVQFYMTENNKQILATKVVEVFKVKEELTAKLGILVIVGPYTDDSVVAQESDHVEMQMSVPQSQDLKDSKFRNELSDKLANIYIQGKSLTARRKKRAIGSVSAKIVNVTAASGSANYADVKFYVIDAGKAVSAATASTTMNKLNKNKMSLIASPYAVITVPRPVAIVTETPPVTVAPVTIPYWIIGAVLGPICLIIIIILLIYWRWRSGAPQSKVEPVQHKPEIIHKQMQPPKSFDTARYVEGRPPPHKIKTMTERVDDSYETLPRREMSLRRKVSKTPMHKRTKAVSSRTNAAYDETEEDDDQSFTDVSRTGSRERIVVAQPGPGMKRKRITSVPTKAAPKRHPVREEETDTGVSEEESDGESIASTRTDQTRHSAAQVPKAAVMAGSSGREPHVPVRFRSSVHPVSSLPPLKQTSLVGAGPHDEETEEESPRKTKRRSKAAQQELKQKADLERQRNKKRQRERKNKVSPAQSNDKRAWNQDRLDQVLDPQPVDPFSRGKRKKGNKSKKAGHFAEDDDGVELKSFKRNDELDRTADQEKDEEESDASSDDSSISMDETRRRMHTLLDDAFSLLGPLSKRQQQIQRELEPPQTLTRPPAPPRYAGSRPALPEPPPAHGRATEPTPRQKRRLMNSGGFPNGLPQTPIGPGYPVRPPMRPPVVTSDPVVVWDPYDRQRYIDQRMGYQPTYSYRDPNGQNVYITPVQQQRDYMGGPVWSPYAAEDTMEEIYPDLAKASYPGAFDTSPSKDPYNPEIKPRDTRIDMSASDPVGKRGVPLGSTPEPLIRSIKEELLRLSNGGVRRSNITEI